MKNLFLTEIKNKEKKRINHTISPINYNKSAFITKNKDFENIKHSLIDFMINEETEYADLNKCKNFFIDHGTEVLSNHNKIFKYINDKKDKLKSLELVIEQVILK